MEETFKTMQGGGVEPTPLFFRNIFFISIQIIMIFFHSILRAIGQLLNTHVVHFWRKGFFINNFQTTIGPDFETQTKHDFQEVWNFSTMVSSQLTIFLISRCALQTALENDLNGIKTWLTRH